MYRKFLSRGGSLSMGSLCPGVGVSVRETFTLLGYQEYSYIYHFIDFILVATEK